MTISKIAIIGSGNVGGKLGISFSRAGLPVKFGLRSQANVGELLSKCGGGASAGSVPEAVAWGDLVFLTIPGAAVHELSKSLGDALAGKVVVDCGNPLTWQDGPVWAPPPEGSLSAAIAKAAPKARVVKAFNTFGAEHHQDPTLSGAPAQVLYAGDDTEAKQSLAEVARRAGFDPVDAGPLRNAAALENLAVLWIHLAMTGGQGRDFVFRMQRK